jgi:formylglycine-generating enzyme required for sulfatase activity
LKLILIPPGAVPLGESTTRIDAPYRIASTEVTRSQFEQFIASTGYKTDAEASGKGGAKVTKVTVPFNPQPSPENVWNRLNFGTPIDTDPDAPAVYVSARDADAFSRWLTGREPGANYRLPTVAEWAWAVRAGVAGMRPAGTVKEVRRHAPVSSPAPHRVGQFLANPWGLYDGLGNVAEWAADVPPKRPSRRHVCGGCYFEVPAFDTTGTSPEVFAASFIGFRVVCERLVPAAVPGEANMLQQP